MIGKRETSCKNTSLIQRLSETVEGQAVKILMLKRLSLDLESCLKMHKKKIMCTSFDLWSRDRGAASRYMT